MDRSLAVQSLAALTLISATARGETAKPFANLELVSDANARGCLARKQLVRDVERRLGRPVFKEVGADLHLRVAFERQGDAWVSRVTLSDSVGPLGKRELATDAAHCSALDDSLALVVALLVDTPPQRPPAESVAGPAEGSSETSAARPTPTQAAQEPTPIRVPVETLAPREPVRFAARAAALAGFGLAPGVALGAELSVHIALPRFPRLALLGELIVPKNEAVFGGNAGARFSAERLGLELCSTGSLVPSIALSVCGGQRVGQVHVRGFGFDENEESSRLYFSVAAGADASMRVAGPMRLALGARGEVPLTRAQYRVRPLPDRPEVVHQHAPIALTLRAGFEAAF